VSLIVAFCEALIVFFAGYDRFLSAQQTLPVPDARLAAIQAATLTVCALFAFHFSDLYEMRRVRRLGQFAARLPHALVLTVALVGGANLFVARLGIGWWSLAEAIVLVTLLVLPLRALLHYMFAARPFSRRVLVLGTTALASKLVREVLAQPDLRDVVVGVVDDGSGAFRPALPCLRLGAVENLSQIVEGFEPDLIVCALSERHDALMLRELLAARARGVPVEDGVITYERLTGKIAIEYASARAVLFSKEFQASWITLFLARALSLVAAACGLVVLVPLLLPVALLIKLDSEGKVFFLHERVGLGGRPFKLIKFRTMRPGAVQSEWAADNGHRTTRVGYWLRRFRIDELPQFLNILRGDMNLVGPRPHPVTNVELFTENIPYYGLRCSVRPGVTGWAQIRYGYANNLEEETEKMRYDLHYIKHMSFGLDLRILFETVKVVLKGGRSASLVDQPGARVLPVYFGPGHLRNARTEAGSEPQRLREATTRSLTMNGGTTSDGVVSIEERRGKGSRTSSSGIVA
jgi:exopolysaccharide biosynthesis polyprenyl glycosylphosphotransferase